MSEHCKQWNRRSFRSRTGCFHSLSLSLSVWLLVKLNKICIVLYLFIFAFVILLDLLLFSLSIGKKAETSSDNDIDNANYVHKYNWIIWITHWFKLNKFKFMQRKGVDNRLYQCTNPTPLLLTTHTHVHVYIYRRESLAARRAWNKSIVLDIHLWINCQIYEPHNLYMLLAVSPGIHCKLIDI